MSLATIVSRRVISPLSVLVPKSPEAQLVSAGGDNLHLVGTVRLELSLKGQEEPRSVVFSICEGLTSPILLGMDFLSRHVKQFNIAEMTLWLHNSNNAVQCNFVTRGDHEKNSAIEETQVFLVSRVVMSLAVKRLFRRQLENYKKHSVVQLLTAEQLFCLTLLRSQ